MIKKLVFTIIIFLLSLIHCEATETSFTADFSNKFYTYNNGVIFNHYTKDEFKTLDKVEKKAYKQVLKAQKFYNKTNSLYYDNEKYEKYNLKALQYNPYLWMSYLNLCEYYYRNQKYFDCIDKANIILTAVDINAFPLYYRALLLQYSSYYNLGEYDTAYKLAISYINSANNKTDKTQAYWVIANSLLYKSGDKAKNYKEAFAYANKYLHSTNTDFRSNAHEIRYEVFLYQNKIDLAEKEVLDLIKIKPNTNNYIKYAKFAKNKNEKIRRLKLAKDVSLTKEDFAYCFFEIAKLEQSKIDDVVKKLGLYVKTPNWHDVWNSTQYGSNDYWYKRIDKFFESTNQCIKDYRGQNLVACFNQVNEEQEILTRELEEYVFRQQQLAYQQELIRQQQLQNYYQSQSAYYARQNYYESTRPKTYTVTPIGNTYHVNQW